MTLHKKYLLDGSIESEKYGPLAERLEYAWKIYNSTQEKYTKKYKDRAIEFIKKKFATESFTLINKLMALMARNPKKLANYVPQLDDLRFQIDCIPLITGTYASKLKQFVNHTNEVINQLNELIAKYNNACNELEQLKILYQIYLKQKSIQYELPQGYSQDCHEYINIFHHQVFKIIQTQFCNLGVTSLNEQIIKNKINANDSILVDSSSLSEIIANIAPEKIDQLIEILHQGSSFNKEQFINLYTPTEPGYNEYQIFLKTNTIEHLGGENSQNFKITNITNHCSLVLKVELHFNSAKNAEIHLRNNSLNDSLTAIYAERQGSYKQKAKGTICRSLIVTEFCKSSDLESYANKNRPISATTEKALDIYIQMGEFLEYALANGCAIPDMKNSNWLMENDKLKLGDTKSIAFVDNNGILNYHIPKNYWLNLISTSYMDPPEFTVKPVNCSADKIHAFMLGRNLYHFLSKASCSTVKNVIEGNTIDFGHQVFATNEGKKLQKLIIDLTRKKPEDRLTVKEALDRLRSIKNAYTLQHVKNDCKDILEKIKSHQFGKDDIKMKQFVTEYQEKIFKQTDLNKTKQIKKILTRLLTRMNDDPVLSMLHKIINTFRIGCRFFNIGMKAKAKRIEQAVIQLPILERFNLRDNKGILSALASHRHPFQKKPITKDGHIDQAKAANSYGMFKAKFPDPKTDEKSAKPKKNKNI